MPVGFYETIDVTNFFIECANMQDEIMCTG